MAQTNIKNNQTVVLTNIIIVAALAIVAKIMAVVSTTSEASNVFGILALAFLLAAVAVVVKNAPKMYAKVR